MSSAWNARVSGRGETRGGRRVLSDPNPVDIHVGKRLRQRRTFVGMTQEQLGAALGITFQQVQKYERGANRIGASRLFDICQVLDVSPQYFFQGMAGADGSSGAAGFAADEEGLDRETMEMVRAFRQIASDAVRQRLVDLARALARAE
ncbi:MAG: helix-turn-helix domain-containing protein [Alphaproteobacteria bacterium]|nr:helix-turn-helix domain-containing protein [Alphaproteobacteria bacterium]